CLRLYGRSIKTEELCWVVWGRAIGRACYSGPLTLATEDAHYVATEARSMMAGAIAFFDYACFVSWAMTRYKPKALFLTTCAITLWFGVGFGLWRVWLK